MAIHINTSSMLKESLDESIEAAQYCVYYSKTDEKWGKFKTGGCLGYPAGILLFSIIDTIGSYFRKDNNIIIEIDGKKSSINAAGWEHFKILNSKYFNQSLPLNYIKELYNKFRSSLTHNSVLGKKAIMYANNSAFENLQNVAFATIKVDGFEDAYAIFMMELLELCEKAVEAFKADIDTVVPNSRQGRQPRCP